MPKEEQAERGFASQADFETWLAENGETSPGIWLRVAKKGTVGVTYPEAVVSALCYGWIDGQAKSLNESFYLQRFTPRRPKSPWSRINRDRILALVEAGRVQPPGLREIERAKADGRWDAAYEPSSTITVPDDLQARLDAIPVAGENFKKLNSTNRFAILYRLQSAKRPETRVKRLEQYVTMLAEGKTIYP